MILNSIIEGAGNKLIYDYGILGIAVVVLGLALFYIVKYERNRHKEELNRIISDKEETDKKSDILYSEIVNMKTAQIEKYATLQQESNEVHKQTVEALRKTTEALNNNSEIFGKLIQKL